MSEEPHVEIVIIRRHNNDDHEGAHGGVWKVAFADFMTALMAFFLVLWIVNSTSKETRSSVARYFNPIKLSDTTPARKGLKEPKDSDFDAGAQAKGEGAAAHDEAHTPKTDKSQTDAKEIGASANPLLSAQKAVDKPARAEAGALAPSTTEFDAPASFAARENAIFRDPYAAFSPESPQAHAAAIRDERAQPSNMKDGSAAEAAQKQAAIKSADELRADIAALSEKIFGAQPRPAIEVATVSEGLLISLTDALDFSMFPRGSSMLDTQAAKALVQIAVLLSQRPGQIVVRGHTDSQTFRSGTSDNWLLSSTRAHAASRALIVGGINPARVAQLEAYADHKLRDPAHPLAPVNRRIEVLMRVAP